MVQAWGQGVAAHSSVPEVTLMDSAVPELLPTKTREESREIVGEDRLP